MLRQALPPTTTIPSTWKAQATPEGAVNPLWIRSFGDPQLETIVNEALQNNLDLRAAAERVNVASAAVIQARAGIYPKISGVGGTGIEGTNQIANKDQSGAVLQLSWEIDLWGRVRSQASAARAKQSLSQADLEFARQSLSAAVARLWYQAVATAVTRQTTLESIKNLQEMVRLTKVRSEIGNGNSEDVSLAQADLERYRRTEQQLAATEQQLVRSLEAMLGRYPAQELAISTTLVAMPPPIPAGVPSQLLERRPDLVAAERQVAAAFYGIQAAQAARLPALRLTGTGGLLDDGIFRLLNLGPAYWAVGANFLAPVYNAGALKAQVDIAKADQRAALDLYGQAALRAFTETETALANEPLLAEQEKHAQAALDADTEALRLRKIRFNIGNVDAFSVLQVQERQLRSRIDLVAIENARLSNRISLHLALGGDLPGQQQ